MSVAQGVVQGGDDRLTIIPELGMNKYNVPNVPTPGICRGSCTSSMPTAKGFEVAGNTLARLKEQQGAETVSDDVRQRLRKVWSLGDGIAISLFPSGTDVEFLFVLAALGRVANTKAGGSVLSIVTCAGEVGSGTTHAAAGCHFAELLPTGSTANIGASIFPSEAGHVRSVEVMLREPNGGLRAPQNVDEEVESLAVEALTGGTDCCILHLVTGCKTGHSSPSVAVYERLQSRFGNRVMVVVDACQGRMKDGAISNYLAKGFSVMTTGSKFYGGPPFCGVALMPEPVAKELNGHLTQTWFRSVVEGSYLYEYVSAPLIDGKHLFNLKHCLSTCDPLVRGVLLRWNMSLLHIEEYHAIPCARRDELMAAWGAEVKAIISRLGSPSIKVLEEDLHPDAVVAGLFDSSSIISISCRVQMDGQWAEPTVENLRHVHRLMALDLSERCLKHGCQIAPFSTRCFIAQPVALGKEAAPVLRVAAGALQLIEAFGTVGGQHSIATWPHTNEDEVVLTKLAGILENWSLWRKKEEATLSDLENVKYQCRLRAPQPQGILSIDDLRNLVSGLGLCLSANEVELLLRKYLQLAPDCALSHQKINFEGFLDFAHSAFESKVTVAPPVHESEDNSQLQASQ